MSQRIDASSVATVRSFNRTTTQRLGVLHEDFLGRRRPLGQARLLWEVGHAGGRGAEVRGLRARLGLDSGYVSRLLRALERDGLVTVAGDPRDARVRRASLTRAGRAEVRELDRRSDEFARSLLEPLGADARGRLVEAMATVERLLTASMIELAVESPRGEAARWCIEQYFLELARRFDGGFDPARSTPLPAAELAPPGGLLLVARLRGDPVGCGGLRLLGAAAEIKRMWVAPGARGLGLGRRLLAELEREAREHGAGTVRLETNRSLVEAISLYRSAGYREVEPFNDEPYADHWFQKPI